MPRFVEWVDLEFERVFAPCRQRDGSVRSEWVPIGMPKLRPAFTKAVFTVWGMRPSGHKPIGSGVFVAIPNEKDQTKIHIYGVTAHHVAKEAQDIRIDTKDGKSRFVPADGGLWFFEPDWDDLAVFDFTGSLSVSTDDYALIFHEKIITDSFIEGVGIYPGDEGFMLGLFSSVPGKYRNVIAPRFGALSILASDADHITQGNGVDRPSHVFEMHSRPGHSGSPVFLYRTPATSIDQVGSFGWDLSTHNNLFWGLLGIHSRQFWESGETKKAEAYGGSQPILEGDEVDMPSSMTVVVPAKRILELLDMPKMKDERAARESGQKRVAIRPEATQADEKGPNPSHKEDFMRLLSAAATTKPQADRT